MFSRTPRFIDSSLIMQRALQDAPSCSKGATCLRLVLEVWLTLGFNTPFNRPCERLKDSKE